MEADANVLAELRDGRLVRHGVLGAAEALHVRVRLLEDAADAPVTHMDRSQQPLSPPIRALRAGVAIAAGSLARSLARTSVRPSTHLVSCFSWFS